VEITELVDIATRYIPAKTEDLVMARTRTKPIHLIVVGMVSPVLTLVGFGPEYGAFDAGQAELATVFILIVSLGFVLTGWLWLRGRDEGRVSFLRLPGLTLATLGIASFVGSLAVFLPGRYTGFAGALRGILFTIFAFVGTGCLLAGWRWAKDQQMRYPLALLAGGLALGLFYVAHQRLDLLIPNPLLAVIVAVVVGVPTLAFLYGLSPRPSALN
jgi:amino acid transporter